MVVQLEVLGRVQANECAAAEEEAAKEDQHGVSRKLEAGRESIMVPDLQDEETHANNGLALRASISAQVGSVVGGLGRQGGQPDDGVETIYSGHSIGVR